MIAIGDYASIEAGDLSAFSKLVAQFMFSICEYVNELTHGGGWPKAPAARARARSLAAEMHSGFSSLRSQWPFAAASVGCKDTLDAGGRGHDSITSPLHT